MIHLRLLALAARSVAALAFAAVAHPQLSATQTPTRGAAGQVTAFVNVAVVPMDTERVLQEQTVLIESGKITALGPTTKVKVPANALRVDGRGKFLIPGLADLHVHLDEPAVVNDSFPRSFAAFLANGVTTVRNMKGEPWHVTLRERVAKGEILGPRVYTTGPFVTQSYFNSQASAGMSIGETAAMIVAEHRKMGYDFIKLWGESVAVDRETFDTLTALAKQAGIRIVGHTPLRGTGLERALQAHVASIEHLSGSLNLIGELPSSLQEKNVESALNRFPLNESKIPVLAAMTRDAGVWNCPTLLIFTFLFQRYYKDAAPTYLALRSKIVKALHDAGAGLLLGTDVSDNPKGIFTNWPKSPGTSAHEELQLFVEAGLTPYQALKIGTRNAAEFLQTLDSSGTIEIGKRADLVLLNGNPLENIRNTMQPAGVSIGGKWLSREYFDRRLLETHTATTP